MAKRKVEKELRSKPPPELAEAVEKVRRYEQHVKDSLPAIPEGGRALLNPLPSPARTRQRKKLTPKEWLNRAVKRDKRRGNEQPMEYAGRLHELMKTAARANPKLRVMKTKSIANRLAEMEKNDRR
jgi:hypothetical protein